MPLFTYKAVTPAGEVQEGELEAADEQAVIRKLQGDGLIPVKMRSVSGKGLRLELGLGRGRGKRVTQQQITLFTQELATLLEAGLTLDHSFKMLLDLADEPKLVRLLSALQEQVRGGDTFSQALEAQQGLFPSLYINMVRAGEASGALQEVLSRLADYMERSAELRDTVKSALVYPVILLLVAGLSVILLLVFVVPQFAQMFDDMGQTLPLATRIVIGTGDLFRDYWWAMLIGVLGLVSMLSRQLARPEFRYRWDKRLLGMPLIGDLVAKVETARFSRTLSTLVHNGVSLLLALSLVKDVVSNKIIAEAITAAAEELKRGRGLAETLMEQAVLPKLAVQMIKVGEESGKLEPMLEKVANMYDREVKSAVQRMLSLLEPLLIVGLGVIVAGIIISILVAIMSVNQLAF